MFYVWIVENEDYPEPFKEENENYQWSLNKIVNTTLLGIQTVSNFLLLLKIIYIKVTLFQINPWNLHRFHTYWLIAFLLFMYSPNQCFWSPSNSDSGMQYPSILRLHHL